MELRFVWWAVFPRDHTWERTNDCVHGDNMCVQMLGQFVLCCLWCGDDKTVLEYGQHIGTHIIMFLPQGGHVVLAKVWFLIPLSFSIFLRVAKGPLKCLSRVEIGVVRSGTALALGGFPPLCSCCVMNGARLPVHDRMWAGCHRGETELSSDSKCGSSASQLCDCGQVT